VESINAQSVRFMDGQHIPNGVLRGAMGGVWVTFNIESVIASRIPLQRRGAVLTGHCPFHHDETPSFAVSPIHERFLCLSCEATGDAIDFVARFECVSREEALRLITASHAVASSVSV
jgi:DNA primase